jgi:beta-mannosidase
MNQVLQGDAIKTAMEAHRRMMPYNMGSLYWQHNDVWPVASWSARDYYGRWKAQQYFARDAYRDILVSPIEENGIVNIYTVSDRIKEATGTLDVKLMKLDGQQISQQTSKVRVRGNSVQKQFSLQIADLLKNVPRGDVVVYVSFTEKGGPAYTNHYFLVKQKDVNYPKVTISRTIKPVSGGFEISLQSDKYARAVFMSIEGLDNFFENNYFDLLPGVTVTTKVRTGLAQAEFEKQLKVISLVDGY